MSPVEMAFWTGMFLGFIAGVSVVYLLRKH